MNLRAALDVQWAGAVAKNATIDLVATASTNTTDGTELSDLYIVDEDLAPVMNVSYGSCESDLGGPGNEFYNSLWAQAAAEGITVVVATGDNSAASCDAGGGSEGLDTYAIAGLTVSGLASTPYNVAVAERTLRPQILR